MSVKSVVVCLLVAFPISFTDKKQTEDQNNDIHNKGDSFFSQRGGSNPQTCEPLGTCQVSYNKSRNPPLIKLTAFLDPVSC